MASDQLESMADREDAKRLAPRAWRWRGRFGFVAGVLLLCMILRMFGISTVPKVEAMFGSWGWPVACVALVLLAAAFVVCFVLVESKVEGETNVPPG